MRLVLGQGLRLAGTGATIGIVAAMLSGRLMESQFSEIRSFDLFTMAMAVGALTSTALLASWLPARWAMRADPSITLRYE